MDWFKGRLDYLKSMYPDCPKDLVREGDVFYFLNKSKAIPTNNIEDAERCRLEYFSMNKI